MPKLLLLLAAVAFSMPGCDDKHNSAPTNSAPAAIPPAPKLDSSHAKKVSTRAPDGQTFKGLTISTALPWDIQLGKHGSLAIEDEGKSNLIRDGEATLGLDAKDVGIDRALRVHNFIPDTDTALVQVNAGLDTETSLAGKVPENGLAPVLIDSLSDKNVYFPVGYVYEDEFKIIIRFTPGNVIQKFGELPSLSRSRPAQRLTLLYRVNVGRSIKYFALDNAAVVQYDPPLPINAAK